jgi:hypothetical protein
MIHEAVSRWGRDLGIRTVDLLPRFRGLDHRTYMIKHDGHPNARAHAAIAEAVRAELLPLLVAPGRSER